MHLVSFLLPPSSLHAPTSSITPHAIEKLDLQSPRELHYSCHPYRKAAIPIHHNDIKSTRVCVYPTLSHGPRHLGPSVDTELDGVHAPAAIDIRVLRITRVDRWKKIQHRSNVRHHVDSVRRLHINVFATYISIVDT